MWAAYKVGWAISDPKYRKIRGICRHRPPGKPNPLTHGGNGGNLSKGMRYFVCCSLAATPTSYRACGASLTRNVS